MKVLKVCTIYTLATSLSMAGMLLFGSVGCSSKDVSVDMPDRQVNEDMIEDMSQQEREKYLEDLQMRDEVDSMMPMPGMGNQQQQNQQ